MSYLGECLEEGLYIVVGVYDWVLYLGEGLYDEVGLYNGVSYLRDGLYVGVWVLGVLYVREGL